MSWDGVVPRPVSALEARVLRAIAPMRERTIERVAVLAGCSVEEARGCVRRLARRQLIEPDGCRPTGWLRTHQGDRVLEHQS